MSTEKREVRLIDVAIEFRKETDKPTRVSGYAARFNEPSQPLAGGRFIETIAPGAFRNALAKKANVPLLIQHDGLALADTATGTLTLSEDKQGLRFDADLDPADPDAQRVLPKLERGTLRKMSFGFIVADKGDDWTTGKSGVRERTVRDVEELIDVSLVTSPAYPSTSAALRSLEAFEALGQAPDWKVAADARARSLALTELG